MCWVKLSKKISSLENAEYSGHGPRLLFCFGCVKLELTGSEHELVEPPAKGLQYWVAGDLSWCWEFFTNTWLSSRYWESHTSQYSGEASKWVLVQGSAWSNAESLRKVWRTLACSDHPLIEELTRVSNPSDHVHVTNILDASTTTMSKKCAQENWSSNLPFLDVNEESLRVHAHGSLGSSSHQFSSTHRQCSPS